jgi:hypothetical protein
MFFAVKWSRINKMQVQNIEYQKMIDEAVKKAKWKKALYVYDDTGNKNLLGVFSKKKAQEIKEQLKKKNMLNRMTEFDIKTTEPDSMIDCC